MVVMIVVAVVAVVAVVYDVFVVVAAVFACSDLVPTNFEVPRRCVHPNGRTIPCFPLFSVPFSFTEGT